MPVALAVHVAPPLVVLYTRAPPRTATYLIAANPNTSVAVATHWRAVVLSKLLGSSVTENTRSRSAAAMPFDSETNVPPARPLMSHDQNTPPLAGPPMPVCPNTVTTTSLV